MTAPLLYIHGFGSSGHSGKAGILRRHFERVYAPTLPPVPKLAIDTLEQFTDLLEPDTVLVGSSLGGFYALHLAQRFGLPAALVNPALEPWAALERVVGLNRNYFDGARFETTTAHVESLRRYRVEAPTVPVLLLAKLGDELLDHHRTRALLPAAEAVLEAGGDHAYSDFETAIPRLRGFIERAHTSVRRGPVEVSEP